MSHRDQELPKGSPVLSISWLPVPKPDWVLSALAPAHLRHNHRNNSTISLHCFHAPGLCLAGRSSGLPESTTEPFGLQNKNNPNQPHRWVTEGASLNPWGDVKSRLTLKLFTEIGKNCNRATLHLGLHGFQIRHLSVFNTPQSYSFKTDNDPV